jgi:hypothetical protein
MHLKVLKIWRLCIKWGTTCGASTLSRYFWPVRLPSRTSNLQSKEKQPQTVTPPSPKAVVPKMWLSWNEVFLWRQTLARPSVGRNEKRLSSDQWSFIFYWFGMVRRKLTIPERWQAVGRHNGGFSHRRVADHFRVNHSIIVRLMQRFRQTGKCYWPSTCR